MKTTRTLFLAAALCFIAALLLPGCASPEQGAYRSIGTTATLVDGAMNGWGDYVRAGLASTADEATVKGLYEEYQGAMTIAHRAVTAFRADPDSGRTALDRALEALEASSGQLVALIARVTGARE